MSRLSWGQLARAIVSIWKVRNSIVHDVDVPDRDVVSATELADYALSVLSKLASTA
jgi:hypothetical protein